jgi:hypothetical protein
MNTGIILVWFRKRSKSDVESCTDFFIDMMKLRTIFEHAEMSVSWDIYHNQLQFPALENSGSVVKTDDWLISVGADMERGCFVRYRTFVSKGYKKYIPLECSLHEIKNMMIYAKMQTGKPYMKNVMLSFLHPMLPNEKSWFCTQLVVAVMQQGNRLQGVNPTEVSTGDELYHLLTYFYPVVKASFAAKDKSEIIDLMNTYSKQVTNRWTAS